MPNTNLQMSNRGRIGKGKTDPVLPSQTLLRLIHRSDQGAMASKGECQIKLNTPTKKLWVSFCEKAGIPPCCAYAVSHLYRDEEWMPDHESFGALYELGSAYFAYPKGQPESVAMALAQRVSGEEKAEIIKHMGKLIDLRLERLSLPMNYGVIVMLIRCGALPVSRLERLPGIFAGVFGAKLLDQDRGL